MDSSFNSILLCSLHSLYWFQDISLGQGLGHQYFTFQAMFTFPATENTASAMKESLPKQFSSWTYVSSPSYNSLSSVFRT